MSRVGATISGFERQLLQQLSAANADAELHSLRLATGKLVSKPADNPSAFLQVSHFEQRLNVVTKTQTQVEAAANIAAQLQLIVDQVRTELENIRDALVADEGQTLTADERATKQAEIDDSLNRINTLAGTEVNGERLLDGSRDYTFSGLNREQISNVDVRALGETTLSGGVTNAATQATLTYTGAAGAINSGAAILTLTGQRGSVSIDVAAGESLADVRDRINLDSHNSGVTASVASNTLTFTSVDYGESATIELAAASGTFGVTGGNGDGTAAGTDVQVVINGVSADDNDTFGNRVSYNRNGLRATIEFAAGFSGEFDTTTISDPRVLEFALSTDIRHKTSLALPSLHVAMFRGLSGSLDELLSDSSLAGLGANTSQAIRVVDEALGRLTSVESHVTSFADIAVATSKSLLAGFKTTLDTALKEVNGIDENEESLRLSTATTLGANALAALSIIQQQQLTLIAMIQRSAGF